MSQGRVAAPPRLMAKRLSQVRKIHSIPRRVFLLALVFYSFLLFSPEVSVNINGLALPSYRIALLLLSFPAFMWFVKGPKGALSIVDLAVFIACVWIVLSFSIIYGFAGGVIRAGGVVVDVGISYFIARASIATLDDLRYFLVLVAPGIILAGALLFVESVSGVLIVRPAFASVFGAAQYSVSDGGSITSLTYEKRLGLLRAYGPFGHPILAGVLMISLLPIYLKSGLRSWPFFGGIAACLSGVFGLSSATFLALGLVILALMIDKIRPLIPKLNWWTVVTCLIFALLGLQIVSKNGLIPIISRLTLMPHTAHYRRAIWEYGWQNVEKNPWFGLGYQSWDRLSWMHDSVDAHFLLLAMRHGLVVPAVLLCGMFFMMIRAGILSSRLKKIDRELLVGVNISLVVLFFVGQTVAFFGSMHIVFMSLLGILASLTNWAERSSEPRQQIYLITPV